MDEVKELSTWSWHFLYARQGGDGDAYMVIGRRPSDMIPHINDLRRVANMPRFVQGRLRYLQHIWVFRCATPNDPLLRQGFSRTIPNGGFLDAHMAFQERRVRFIQDRGDVDDITTWFDDPEAAQLEVERLVAMGQMKPPAPPPGELGEEDTAALDMLDELPD